MPNGYYIKGYEQKEAKPFETLELVASKKDEVKDYIDKSSSIGGKERLRWLLNLGVCKY